MNEYTDLEFWRKYWMDFKPVPVKNAFFDKIIMDLPGNSKLIEIGGFPGMLAAYFKKVKNYDVTILDFYIDPTVIKKVEEVNDLQPGSVNFIKGDFLEMDLVEEYDIVCSFGFLEHFKDTKNILEKHLKLLKKGGTLLITIPNFRGLNGLFQKIVHYENYEKHNIECMNIKNLKFIVQKLKLERYQIEFFGKPCIWLEKEANAANFVYPIVDNINRVLRRLPFKKNFFLAPHIFIKAIKS